MFCASITEYVGRVWGPVLSPCYVSRMSALSQVGLPHRIVSTLGSALGLQMEYDGSHPISYITHLSPFQPLPASPLWTGCATPVILGSCWVRAALIACVYQQQAHRIISASPSFRLEATVTKQWVCIPPQYNKWELKIVEIISGAPRVLQDWKLLCQQYLWGWGPDYYLYHYYYYYYWW